MAIPTLETMIGASYKGKLLVRTTSNSNPTVITHARR